LEGTELNGYDRDFLKANWNRLEGFSSDQSLGETIPPMQKSLPGDAQPIPLGEINHADFSVHSLDEMIARRKSVRKFTESKLTVAELAWLLWATQGVRGMFRDDSISMRTVPSGGSRHPFETYLVVNRVEGLERGLYRYLPIDHSLVLLSDCPDEDTVTEAFPTEPSGGMAPYPRKSLLWTRVISVRISTWRLGRSVRVRVPLALTISSRLTFLSE